MPVKYEYQIWQKQGKSWKDIDIRYTLESAKIQADRIAKLEGKPIKVKKVSRAYRGTGRY